MSKNIDDLIHFLALSFPLPMKLYNFDMIIDVGMSALFYFYHITSYI